MTYQEFNREIVPLKDKIYRCALAVLGNRMDAEDMVQDTYGKLWTIREKLDALDNREAYAMRMVRNLCLDHLRAARLHEEKLEEEFSHRTEEGPGQQEELKDMDAVVRQVIARLPEKPRTVIHLRDVEGYEMEEIAAIVGDDVATVRVTLSRARKTVREKVINIMNYGIR
ncbi:MAG: sigma-70 family RNA polymerase sigma factor [Bacteroidales bacterium]|nr:sigma-70 family RNA polymerase sigma factor [Bacteroidales bacterium]